MLAFVRLKDAVTMDGVLDVSIPVRFLVVVLGPDTPQISYHEIGRAIATMMSERVRVTHLPLPPCPEHPGSPSLGAVLVPCAMSLSDPHTSVVSRPCPQDSVSSPPYVPLSPSPGVPVSPLTPVSPRGHSGDTRGAGTA